MKDTTARTDYIVMQSTKRRFLLVLPLLALMAGCGSGSLPSRKVGLNEDIVVQLGEQVLLLGQGTTIEVDSLLEDSRCPLNANCVDAGKVRVGVLVKNSKGNFTQESKFPLLSTETIPVPASKYSVAISAVTPDRTDVTPIPQQNYRFTIRVSRAQ